jgi:hypothetical protein
VELSQAPGKATDLEKMYIAAIAARRNPEAKDPEEAFVKGLRALLAAHPGEVEAELDLALMIMRGFTQPEKKPVAPGSMEAVAILRALLIQAPDHPGVHHYIIHAFEGSTFAKDAWPSCEKYTQLVPNIPHALHMPGHIYSQTGRWSDAEKSFAAAAVNERMWMAQDKLYGNGHHGHNVHYLATAYSFEGRYDDAIEAAKELLAVQGESRATGRGGWSGHGTAQGWFAMLRTWCSSRNGTRFWPATCCPCWPVRVRRPGGTGRERWHMPIRATPPRRAMRRRSSMRRWRITARGRIARIRRSWKWRGKRCKRTWNWPPATRTARSSYSSRPARRNGI